ncbi:hypothetical protein GDO86_010711 [Hymenochirus boettgeri]|uniref:Uncharacterized protein n=1 Tax=Hymenochirus boettgeri TaxID=247094 RepID=A0A8T2JDS2_9PIPI|nr:hypothetical protein GDO86_010711 [Hymenochirus boettgeri]
MCIQSRDKQGGWATCSYCSQSPLLLVEVPFPGIQRDPAVREAANPLSRSVFTYNTVPSVLRRRRLGAFTAKHAPVTSHMRGS